MKKFLKSNFVQEFKKFISQGSVMDLAVGMVIGAAFSKIVSSLVADIIMPVVGILVGGVDFSKLSVSVPNFFGGDTAATITYGNFIQNVVDFLVVAFALFMFIRVVNKINEKAANVAKAAAKKLGKEEAAKEAEEAKEKAAEKKEDKSATAEQIKLLREIRDSLADKKKPAKK